MERKLCTVCESTFFGEENESICSKCKDTRALKAIRVTETEQISAIHMKNLQKIHK